MEQSTLLIAEVLGMIGVAGFLTVALVRDRAVFERPRAGETMDDVSRVLTSIFCPEWRTNADVTLGPRGMDPKKHMGIVTCDLLREGETCDQACLGAVANA